MHVFYLYATVVVLSPTLIMAAQTRFMPEIQNISCQNFTNHLKHYECDYQKVANGKYFLNTKFMYDTKFGKDVDMEVRLRITPLNSKTSFNFFDLRVNVCAVTSQTGSNGLLQKLFKEVIRTSNLPFDCSFKANFLYKVENYSLTDELIPVYAPFLNAMFSLKFFKDNKQTADWTMYAALIPKQ